jgi:hypothetical protein
VRTGLPQDAGGGNAQRRRSALFQRLEQMNIENTHLLCMGLSANPCHEIVARRMYFAVSGNLKCKML